MKPEPIWHIEVAVLIAILLQLSLSHGLVIGPKYFVAITEILLLIGLRLTATTANDSASKIRRVAGVALTAIVSFVNISSLVLVCRYLINGGSVTGKQLIVSALAIYLTNMIVFGLWYWQLDGGGQGGRGTHRPPVDFLFPQMSTSDKATEQYNWRPSFMDYLFISLTNGTAFSPTDALPLTHRAKFLMSIQALVSLSTVALVAARAINILG